MAFDPQRNLIYVSEFESNWVIAARFVNNSNFSGGNRNSDWIIGYEAPSKKPKGVTRVLLVGDSLHFSGTSYKGEMFPYRLESQLNLRASLKGTGKRYEVHTLGTARSAIPGGAASWFAGQEEFLTKLEIDIVLLGMDYYSLVQETFGFIRSTSKDDVLNAKFDPEHQLDGLDFETLGPLQKDVANQLLANEEAWKSFIHHDPKSGRWAVRFVELESAGLAALNSKALKVPAAKVVGRNLRAALEVSKKNKAQAFALYFPTRETMRAFEVVDRVPKALAPLGFYDALDEQCAQVGIPVIDLVRPAKVLSAGQFPLAIKDGHMVPNAHWWLAQMTAEGIQEFFERAP